MTGGLRLTSPGWVTAMRVLVQCTERAQYPIRGRPACKARGNIRWIWVEDHRRECKAHPFQTVEDSKHKGKWRHSSRLEEIEGISEPNAINILGKDPGPEGEKHSVEAADLNGVCGLDGGVGTELVSRFGGLPGNYVAERMGFGKCTLRCLEMMGYYVCSLPSKDSEKIMERKSTHKL